MPLAARRPPSSSNMVQGPSISLGRSVPFNDKGLAQFVMAICKVPVENFLICKMQTSLA